MVAGRAFTDPADARGPVIKYRPATSPARTVHITDAFAAKHAEIATVLRDTCRAWSFEVDLEAPGRPPRPPPRPTTKRHCAYCCQQAACFTCPTPRAPSLPHAATNLRGAYWSDIPRVAQAFLAKYNSMPRIRRSQMALFKRQDEVVEARHVCTCVTLALAWAPRGSDTCSQAAETAAIHRGCLVSAVD